MRKSLLAIAAGASLAAATFVTPTPAEAGCRGCWVGAGIAAGVLTGAAIANAGYYGYYQPAYYYGYRPYYRPRYYGYYAPRYYNPRYGYGYYQPYRHRYRW